MWYASPNKVSPRDGGDPFSSSMMRQYTMAQSRTAVTCENCEDHQALLHCISCDASLCQECDTLCHSSKITSKHVRGPMHELRTVKCSVHGEMMKLYCNQCSMLVCRDCVDYGEHKSHSVNLLNKSAERQRAELRALMAQACAIVTQLSSVAQQVNHTLHYLGVESLQSMPELPVRTAGKTSGQTTLPLKMDSLVEFEDLSIPVGTSEIEGDNEHMVQRAPSSGTSGEGTTAINEHFDALISILEDRRTELLNQVRSVTLEKASALGAQARALNAIITRCNEAIDRCRVAIKANDNGVAAAYVAIRDSLEQAINIDMSLHLQPVADSHMCISLPDSLIDAIHSHGNVGGPGTPKEVNLTLKNNYVHLSWVSGTNKKNGLDETYVIQQTIMPDSSDDTPIITEIDRTKPKVLQYDVDVSGLNSKRLSFRIKAVDSMGNESFLSAALDIIIPDILAHKLQFEYEFDENGLFYHIGTEGHTKPYQNPHNSGQVVAALSNIGGFLSSHPHKFVGRHPDGFNFTNDQEGSWMGVDIGPKRRLIPNHYCLMTDQCPRKLRTWELQAMVGGENGEWITLRKHENDDSLTEEPHSVAHWPLQLKDETPFRYFRIVQTGPNSTNSFQLACGGIELYGSYIELQ